MEKSKQALLRSASPSSKSREPQQLLVSSLHFSVQAYNVEQDGSRPQHGLPCRRSPLNNPHLGRSEATVGSTRCSQCPAAFPPRTIGITTATRPGCRNPDWHAAGDTIHAQPLWCARASTADRIGRGTREQAESLKDQTR